VADHEPVTLDTVVEPDLLDTQVPRDGLVAPLVGERRLGLLAVGAQILADDVVPAGALQVAAVALGAKSSLLDH
jgi:hypothetical protein